MVKKLFLNIIISSVKAEKNLLYITWSQNSWQQKSIRYPEKKKKYELAISENSPNFRAIT